MAQTDNQVPIIVVQDEEASGLVLPEEEESISSEADENRPSTTEQQSNQEKKSAEKPQKKRKKKRTKIRLFPSNIFQFLSLSWIFSILKFRNLTESIFVLSDSETATLNSEKLQNHFQTNLLEGLKNAFGRQYLPLGLFKIFWGVFTLGNYYSLLFLLQTRQHLFAITLFICSVLSSMCFHHLTIGSTRIGIQCRAALMVMIYRKSLKLSYVKGGVGDIVNLISIECNRIAEACVFLHYLWSAAFECLFILLWSYVDVGIAALVPCAIVILILFPLQFFLAVKASSSACKLTGLITKRVHLMSEVLTAIKLIKFYTWEGYYRKKISDMRNLEMQEMKRELLLKIASFAIVFATPAVLTCIGVALFYSFGNELTADRVFTLLFLFNTLRYPLLFLPNAERNINGAQTALKKLEEFFLLPELDELKFEKCEEPGVCMQFKDAAFIWDGDLEHPHINDLNLTLKRGSVVAIVGDIGSGKSLIAAIMGQLKMTAGVILTDGSKCGFVSQEPWFINATLKENILFGMELKEKKYAEAIRISGLTRDFMLLSNGDESFVNELNLTPSQRQRLSIARCIYHDPDIILMEDCLSDFDQSQAKQLFKESIKNQLAKSKCVVMLTQQKQFLPECDLIVVMKNGRVVEQGTYLELKSRNVNFSAWVTDVVHHDDDPNGVIENMSEIKLDPSSSTNQTSMVSPLRPVNETLMHLQLRKAKPRSSPLASAKPINADQATIKQLIEMNSTSLQNTNLNEHAISKMIERGQNSVLTGNSMRPPTNFANQDLVTRTIEANHLTVHSLHNFDVGTMEAGEDAESISPYFQFFRDYPGEWIGYLFLFLFLISHAFRFVSDVWLVYLIDEKGPGEYEKNIIILSCLCSLIVLSILSRGFAFLRMVAKKGSFWHSKILESVLQAPMSFYDVTPLGHILSFFAKHLFSVDEILPDTAMQVLTFLPLVFGAMTVACIYVPWLWATLPLYFIGWIFVSSICISSQNIFKHLETSNKSPMFAHLSTTLEGLFLIRLYHTEERFDYFNRTLIDADHKALYSLLLVRAFMSLCLDIVSCFFIYFTALFVVLFQVPESHSGIAVTNALQLLLFVPWLVKMIFELDNSMSSVSSLLYFGEKAPKEPTSRGAEPPSEWPERGEIEFKEVTSKYHRYGVSVLKNVSFHILPREKIAIVGRSGLVAIYVGSGKTTLLMSLLRIIEPSEGMILIDGIDTGTISLTNLRSRMAIIPQEPVMLTGTIRSNLDPFGNSTDAAIWSSLRAVHLGEKIMEMPDKLETSIAGNGDLTLENGRMFNVSERQLFCIARAILIQSSIVVYDEPAVTVDRDTERLIQQVMNENFSHCTVIFLATRFRVIVQMDRVMVMKHGEIVEFDTPLNLLDNPKSKFSLMLSQTGDVDPAALRALAMKKAGIEAPSMLRTSSRNSTNLPRQLGELFYSASSQSSVSDTSVDGRISDSKAPLIPPSSSHTKEEL